MTQAELDHRGAGELGWGTEPTPFGVESLGQPDHHGLEGDVGIDVGIGRWSVGTIPPQRLVQADLALHGVHQGIGLAHHLFPLADPRRAQGLHHPPERRHAVALLGWEVGAGVEGTPVGSAED